ncbi:hypothetical protein B0H13DRAFT_2328370 [Mycena leptocephala]|nr:hypothetical protein B0H13DRAFT_2328370 [Mycena leptocephala]
MASDEAIVGNLAYLSQYIEHSRTRIIALEEEFEVTKIEGIARRGGSVSSAHTLLKSWDVTFFERGRSSGSTEVITDLRNLPTIVPEVPTPDLESGTSVTTTPSEDGEDDVPAKVEEGERKESTRGQNEYIELSKNSPMSEQAQGLLVSPSLSVYDACHAFERARGHKQLTAYPFRRSSSACIPGPRACVPDPLQRNSPGCLRSRLWRNASRFKMGRGMDDLVTKALHRMPSVPYDANGEHVLLARKYLAHIKGVDPMSSDGESDREDPSDSDFMPDAPRWKVSNCSSNAIALAPCMDIAKAPQDLANRRMVMDQIVRAIPPSCESLCAVHLRGIYVVTLGFCLKALLRTKNRWKRSGEISKPMLVVTILMGCIATFDMCLTFAINLNAFVF